MAERGKGQSADGPRRFSAFARRRGRSFTHDAGVGEHRFLFDEPPDKGGDDEGPSPTEMVAAALAGCTAITVEMYADRKGWDLGQIEVSVEAEGSPRSGFSYEVTLHLPGGLTEEQTQRIKVIAGKCPVHRQLAGETPITITDRVEIS